MTLHKTIVDANENRVREGLRVLEEVARFILRDKDLSFSIRELRRKIRKGDSIYGRQVEQDPGALSPVSSRRQGLMDLVHANACRVEEGLRVLEEFSGEPDLYREVRFEAYKLHQKLVLRLGAFLKFERLKGIYLLFDPDQPDLSGFPIPPEKAALIASESAISLFQLRKKQGTKKEIVAAAEKIRKILRSDILFLVNDHVDVALHTADGVHLGRNDFPVDVARKLVQSDFVIGASCNNPGEAREAEEKGASYISVGCLFETRSKTDTRPASLETLRTVKANARVPVCAIGGIKTENMPRILETKPDLVAVMSEVWQAEDPPATLRKLCDFVQGGSVSSAGLFCQNLLDGA